MRKLIEARYPVYAEADITVESRDVPHEVIVDAVIDALGAKLGCKAKPAAQKAAKPGAPQEGAMMDDTTDTLAHGACEAVVKVALADAQLPRLHRRWPDRAGGPVHRLDAARRALRRGERCECRAALSRAT